MKTICLIISFIINLSVYSQTLWSKADSVKVYPFCHKNTVYAEGLGSGLGSFNFERVLTNKYRRNIGLKAGFMYFPKFTNVKTFWIPVGFNFYYRLCSSNQHHALLSGGLTFTPEESIDSQVSKKIVWDYFYNLQGGYQFMSKNGKLALAITGSVLLENLAISNYKTYSYLTQNKKKSFGEYILFNLIPLPGFRIGYRF